MNNEFENDFLLLSDDKCFYTVEGEGAYAGHPSVFLRLAKCNLTCKGFISPSSPHGCDSYISWSKVTKMSFEEIALMMEAAGYDKFFKYNDNNIDSSVIFKITGGEPLLQQKSVIKFIEFLSVRWGPNTYIHIDFETNGTLKPLVSEWYEMRERIRKTTNYGSYLVITYTISPKLTNNGDSFEKRFNKEALEDFLHRTVCTFKFVVKNEEDVKEVMETYVQPLEIPHENLWFMPCCGNRQELIEESIKVAELCKKYKVKFSPRLQLLIWDKALKV